MDKDALRVAVEHKAAVPMANSATLLDTKIGTKAKRGMIRPTSSIVRKAASTGAEQTATRNLSMWVEMYSVKASVWSCRGRSIIIISCHYAELHLCS